MFGAVLCYSVLMTSMICGSGLAFMDATKHYRNRSWLRFALNSIMAIIELFIFVAGLTISFWIDWALNRF